MSEEAMDVLAAVDEFATDYTGYIPQFHAGNRKRMKRTVADLREARAIVAELIAADREFDAAMTSPANAKDLTAALRRFDAAKARRAAILSRIKD